MYRISLIKKSALLCGVQLDPVLYLTAAPNQPKWTTYFCGLYLFQLPYKFSFEQRGRGFCMEWYKPDFPKNSDCLKSFLFCSVSTTEPLSERRKEKKRKKKRTNKKRTKVSKYFQFLALNNFCCQNEQRLYFPKY